MRRIAFTAFIAAVLSIAPLLASASAKLVPDLAGLASVPQIALPVAVVQKGLKFNAQRKGLPLQFAVRVPMALGLSDGLWDEVDTDTARWRLKLYSPGAVSLHVHFSQFRLPEGAELWFYDSAGQLVQGPLTSAQHTSDGRLATALVLGETAAIELRTPKALRDQVRLQISDVFHGYRDIRKAGFPGKQAGACERDVACPEGAPFANEIRSVVLLELDGGLCSGQLVNNVRQDETPFVLTANHCQINGGNASLINAYFNVQSSTCGGSNGNLDQVVNGTSFETANSDSDTTLIRLINQPEIAYSAFYSGWDASGDAVSSGAGIHHPQGDEKSISIFNTAPQKREDACFQEDLSGQCLLRVDGWEVEWFSAATEAGSSGSGLWNQSKRLVGVLSGGASDCAGNQGNGQPDLYGRLDVAFALGSLKSKLDPDNSGALTLAGRNATASGGTTGGSTTGNSTGSPFAGSGSGGGGGGGWTLGIAALLAFLLRKRLGP